MLCRGRRFRHKISRRLLRMEWNHLLLMATPTKTLELTWEQGVRYGNISEYEGRQIVVLRPVQLDLLTYTALDSALKNYESVNFDWMKFLFQCLRIIPVNRKGFALCDEFAGMVYKKAFLDVNFRSIMENDLGSQSYRNGNCLFEKIVDYRYAP